MTLDDDKAGLAGGLGINEEDISPVLKKRHNDNVKGEANSPMVSWDKSIISAKDGDPQSVSDKISAPESVSWRLYETIFNSVLEGVIYTDLTGNIILANDAACSMFGWKSEELVGQNVKVLMPYNDQKKYDSYIKNHVDDGERRVVGRGRTLMGIRKDKSAFPIYLSITKTEANFSSGFVGLIQDISKQKEAEFQLNQLAYFCNISGLMNRSSLDKYLERIVERSTTPCHPVSFVQVRISDFHTYVSLYGHKDVGLLVSKLAKKLEPLVKEYKGFLSRSADSDFIVVLDGDDGEKAIEFTDTIEKYFAEPVRLNSQKIAVGLSIGLHVIQAGKIDTDDILKELEIATIEAQKSDVTNVMWFDEALRKKTKKQFLLDERLKLQVQHFSDFHLVFQPKIDVANNVVCGAEALIRWVDPVIGFVSPADFIPIAERNGTIAHIGEWILTQSIKIVKDLDEIADSPFHVAVNVSPHQFTSGVLVETIRKTLTRLDCPPALLQIEITEGTLMVDIDQTIKTLSELRDLGVKVAIDDFGTGFSSLSLLQKLPLDVLKIDKTFVDGIPENEGSLAIVRAIAEMSRSLNFAMIAEGVENESQLATIRAFGCDVIQGYIFSKPLDREAFEDYLNHYEAPQYYLAI